MDLEGGAIKEAKGSLSKVFLLFESLLIVVLGPSDVGGG
eukprot:CAMPEP_0196761080 /NCGR_PEP_ID=MMETSP1095-20130614/194_1 /TAXON_ID=96789 ORGANISM="Chromulina nebulosa, Strain UTEXLB2642" /NCGR_SAMPLE_ID=MMETSP1095 /ASSEMBLY_ACC=CAM_ASM_000446 /LENGTH=38 /DNA_ID= /DNA_START= /DNA_END= /DNA_ORIENTATION=